MGEGLKIVTIGGGSSYTPELIEGFIKRYNELPVREIYLVDINEGKNKLEIIGALAKRMVKKANLPIEINWGIDRRLALKDADFVTTQFRVGNIDARILDEEIPLSHGVIGQETNGPGGIFKAFRTIPVILDLVNDVEEICPNAWIINFTNPAGMVTEAVFRYTNFKKFIGLCNVPIGIHMQMAEALEVESSRIEIDFAGLNHLVYGLDIRLDGISIKDDVLGLTKNISMKNIKGLDWDIDFIRALNAIPCPYHRYYYKTKEMLEDELESYQKGIVRGRTVKELEKELFELYKDENLDIKPKQLEQRGGAYYSDAACRLISSIYNDKHDIQPVNTLNNGAISSLPNDVVVEITSVITKEGPKPINIGELPLGIKGLVQQMKDFELVTVKAAVTGNYYDALLSLSINPLVPSEQIAKVILDEMLEAHKPYVQQFFKNRINEVL